MSDSWSITITPVPKSENCIIRTSDGQEWTVTGLALFADGGDGNLMSYFWNSPKMAASGCYRACAESLRRGDMVAMSFYKCLLKLFALGTGAQRAQVLTADEALRKFEAEETYKVMTKDPEKFN